MPHVQVKLYPGRTEAQKQRLAAEIVKVVVAVARCEEKNVSVAIEDVAPEQWDEKVYLPDIVNKRETLYKKPAYGDR